MTAKGELDFRRTLGVDRNAPAGFRASLGVSSFGMQVMTLPPDWDGYPDHRHDASVEDANQEEVYIPDPDPTVACRPPAA